MSENDAVWGLRIAIYRKDGTVIWISENVRVIRGEDGAVLYYEGTVEDITARKRAEAELPPRQGIGGGGQPLEEPVPGDMSHELRTPLNAIIGYSELMREEAEDLALKSFIRDLTKIESAGKHLLALINGVLDIAKIEAGKMDLHAETFEVARMIEEVSTTVAPVVEKKGNYFESRRRPISAPMHTDLTKVRQSLFNLLGNAGKFTKEGRIRLAVERITDGGRDWLVFQVSDTGVGMTSDQAQKVFAAFTQADASTTRKYGGTGLGLAITREFSRLIGGDVSVKSALGQGSVFTLRVPAELASGSSAETETPGDAFGAPPETADFDQPKVLLIDDDLTVHDLVRRFLQKEGNPGHRSPERSGGVGTGAQDPPGDDRARRHDAHDGRLVGADAAQGRPGTFRYSRRHADDGEQPRDGFSRSAWTTTCSSRSIAAISSRPCANTATGRISRPSSWWRTTWSPATC
ncbi:MAG: PAS domain-containing sensor histidine kinase [Chthoniobacter sp.]